jgi:hypothetical protein
MCKAERGSGGRYGTNNDTNAPPAEMPHPQVIEMSGRLVGTRTPDLYRVNLKAAQPQIVM